MIFISISRVFRDLYVLLGHIETWEKNLIRTYPENLADKINSQQLEKLEHTVYSDVAFGGGFT